DPEPGAERLALEPAYRPVQPGELARPQAEPRGLEARMYSEPAPNGRGAEPRGNWIRRLGHVHQQHEQAGVRRPAGAGGGVRGAARREVDAGRGAGVNDGGLMWWQQQGQQEEFEYVNKGNQHEHSDTDHWRERDRQDD